MKNTTKEIMYTISWVSTLIILTSLIGYIILQDEYDYNKCINYCKESPKMLIRTETLSNDKDMVSCLCLYADLTYKAEFIGDIGE